MKTAIVTLAVGGDFAKRWNQDCRENWQTYAARHGYDVLCIDAPLDTSERARGRSPAWQKCLILSQDFSRRYDRIIWLDADILLNPAAPAIDEGVPPHKVGAVDEFACPTPDEHRRNQMKMYNFWESEGIPFVRNLTPREYYAAWGLPSSFDHVVQTGLLALSPTHHRDLLESVYNAYDEKGPGWNYEMRPLSYELLKADVMHWIDPRFNYIWGTYKSIHFPFLVTAPQSLPSRPFVERALSNVYGLHFTGDVSSMAGVNWRKLPEESSAAPAVRPASRPEAELRTPVCLFVFARPDTTCQVFEAIRAAQPRQLFIVADGPHEGDEVERALCEEVLSIVRRVDWPCDLVTNLSASNLGLRKRLVSGLDWLFKQVEEAIILEDDCLPDSSFFPFCAELLERYRDDDRIFTISGNDFQPGRREPSASYSFSRYPHIWGWATWRRAWKLYEPELGDWSALQNSAFLHDLMQDRHAVSYWSYLFAKAAAGSDTWDDVLLFTSWRHGLLNILPTKNLVSNLGFRSDATHTKAPRSVFAGMPVTAMQFPLRHPESIERDADADRFTEETMFSGTIRGMFAQLKRRMALTRSR